MQYFDEDLDGFITYNEMAAAWRKAAAESGGTLDVPTEAVLKSLLAEADGDGDGKISEEEFYAVIDACA